MKDGASTPALSALDTASAIVTVDLAAIARNWRSVARLVSPAGCAAVVKADAYGLGAPQVAAALAGAGCQLFFVATVGEAAELRPHVPKAAIYVLDGLVPGSARHLLALRARPVLGSLAEVREWAAFCRRTRARHPAILHIDSGMNRLGLEPGELGALLGEPSLLQAFETDYVLSHLASSDDPASPQNEAQRAAFVERTAPLDGIAKSLAASGGILLGRDYDFDLVRPGLILFGGQPSAAIEAPVEPAVRLDARVLQVRSVPRGAEVGYGAAWRARRKSQIATVALGYADGIPRTACNDRRRTGASVAYRGRKAPIVGRISMDLVTVDVTDLSERPSRGDLVEVIGPTIPLGEAARSFGTIPWEVLTRLSRRAARVYQDGAPHGEG